MGSSASTLKSTKCEIPSIEEVRRVSETVGIPTREKEKAEAKLVLEKRKQLYEQAEAERKTRCCLKIIESARKGRMTAICEHMDDVSEFRQAGYTVFQEEPDYDPHAIQPQPFYSEVSWIKK